jgi:hypothetical protein
MFGGPATRANSAALAAADTQLVARAYASVADTPVADRNDDDPSPDERQVKFFTKEPDGTTVQVPGQADQPRPMPLSNFGKAARAAEANNKLGVPISVTPLVTLSPRPITASLPDPRRGRGTNWGAYASPVPLKFALNENVQGGGIPAMVTSGDSSRPKLSRKAGDISVGPDDVVVSAAEKKSLSVVPESTPGAEVFIPEDNARGVPESKSPVDVPVPNETMRLILEMKAKLDEYKDRLEVQTVVINGTDGVFKTNQLAYTELEKKYQYVMSYWELLEKRSELNKFQNGDPNLPVRYVIPAINATEYKLSNDRAGNIYHWLVASILALDTRLSDTTAELTIAKANAKTIQHRNKKDMAILNAKNVALDNEIKARESKGVDPQGSSASAAAIEFTRQLTERNAILQETIDTAREELKAVGRKYTELEQQSEGFASDVGSLQQRIRTTNEEYSKRSEDAKTHYDKLRTEWKDATDRYINAEALVVKLKADVESADGDAVEGEKRLTNENKELEKKLEKSEALLVGNVRVITGLNDDVKKREAEVKTLEVAHKNSIKNCDNEKKLLRDGIAEQKSRLDATEQQNMMLRNEVVRVQGELDRSNTNLEALMAKGSSDEKMAEWKKQSAGWKKQAEDEMARLKAVITDLEIEGKGFKNERDRINSEFVKFKFDAGTSEVNATEAEWAIIGDLLNVSHKNMLEDVKKGLYTEEESQEFFRLKAGIQNAYDSRSSRGETKESVMHYLAKSLWTYGSVLNAAVLAVARTARMLEAGYKTEIQGLTTTLADYADKGVKLQTEVDRLKKLKNHIATLPSVQTAPQFFESKDGETPTHFWYTRNTAMEKLITDIDESAFYQEDLAVLNTIMASPVSWYTTEIGTRQPTWQDLAKLYYSCFNATEMALHTAFFEQKKLTELLQQQHAAALFARVPTIQPLGSLPAAVASPPPPPPAKTATASANKTMPLPTKAQLDTLQDNNRELKFQLGEVRLQLDDVKSKLGEAKYQSIIEKRNAMKALTTTPNLFTNWVGMRCVLMDSVWARVITKNIDKMVDGEAVLQRMNSECVGLSDVVHLLMPRNNELMDLLIVMYEAYRKHAPLHPAVVDVISKSQTLRVFALGILKSFDSQIRSTSDYCGLLQSELVEPIDKISQLEMVKERESEVGMMNNPSRAWIDGYASMLSTVMTSDRAQKLAIVAQARVHFDAVFIN